MFTLTVFSKDRALQLDLTLNSVKENLPFFDNIVVLYNISSPSFHKGYEILMKQHPDVKFIRQKGSIFKNMSSIIDDCGTEYFCMCTDDMIAYTSYRSSVNIHKAFQTPLPHEAGHTINIAVFSLRNGRNITKRNSAAVRTTMPDHMPLFLSDGDTDCIYWSWTSIPYGGYWGYPLSTDGHIYRTKTIASVFEELVVLDRYYSNNKGVPRAKHAWAQTPNVIESKMQRSIYDLETVCACPPRSCFVNSPNNRVQDVATNSHGDRYSYSQQDLNDKFLDGARIDLSKLHFGFIECPHTEIDILEGLV